MEAKDKVIYDIAERACKRVARNAIKHLQQMKDCCMSGDDSCLKNIWDEICVQEQLERSFYWSVYEVTIQSVVGGLLVEIDKVTKAAIWLQTEEGINWEIDNPEASNLKFNDDDIIRYIISDYVMSQAMDYSNSRIEKYREMYSSD